ncbi:MAG: SDR family oxidoreductase [Bacteroidales bacterium]|nr:SDR family oxidoreductase [Bacteroidales bacterium]
MNILINGGSKGMGRATALILAGDPDNSVIVTGRDVNALRSLSADCCSNNITTFELDTTKHDERLKSLKSHLKSENAGIDILINFAGLLHKALFQESDENQARAMMETNFFGPVLFVRELLPFMKRGSHIVNIGSMGGFQGSIKFPGLSWYSASKAALASMTESLAAELSPLAVSVNCLCPGAVQTEMLEKAFPGYRAPLTAEEMGKYLAEFAVTGHKYFNGKILPLSRSTP